MTKHNPYADFRALSKDDQREHILSVSALCLDDAPRSLARKIEIYFDATDDDQANRLLSIVHESGR